MKLDALKTCKSFGEIKKQFPIFKKLQNDGTFFNEMITHAPYTLVSMNSIFTGMYGGKNGINAYYQMYGNPKEGCQTLAEYLSENGWYTCGDAMRLSLVSHKGFNKITSQEDIDDPDFDGEDFTDINGNEHLISDIHSLKSS